MLSLHLYKLEFGGNGGGDGESNVDDDSSSYNHISSFKNKCR